LRPDILLKKWCALNFNHVFVPVHTVIIEIEPCFCVNRHGNFEIEPSFVSLHTDFLKTRHDSV
jgi:hypothetical protein